MSTFPCHTTAPVGMASPQSHPITPPQDGETAWCPEPGTYLCPNTGLPLSNWEPQSCTSPPASSSNNGNQHPWCQCPGMWALCAVVGSGVIQRVYQAFQAWTNYKTPNGDHSGVIWGSPHDCYCPIVPLVPSLNP